MKVIDKNNVLEDKEDYVYSFNNPTTINNKGKVKPSKKLTFVRDYVLCIGLSLFVVGISVFIVVLADGWSQSLIMPIFFPSTLLVIAVTIICYALLMVGLLLACRQGVNKKVYILYGLNAIFNILLLLFLMVFRQSIVGLFMSLLVFYFAFTLYNELKKVNITAKYMFMPYIFWTIFEVVCCYSVVMLN